MGIIHKVIIAVLCVMGLAAELVLAKENLLRNPEALCAIFEKEGLTVSEPWEKNNWRDYSCATVYSPLSDQSGVPTNLAFYVESELPKEVEYMRLTLNVNDDGLYKKGKTKFTKLSTMLLDALGMEEEKKHELLKHIDEESKLTVTSDTVLVELEVLRGATHTLRLIIEKRYGN